MQSFFFLSFCNAFLFLHLRLKRLVLTYYIIDVVFRSQGDYNRLYIITYLKGFFVTCRIRRRMTRLFIIIFQCEILMIFVTKQSGGGYSLSITRVRREAYYLMVFFLLLYVTLIYKIHFLTFTFVICVSRP